MIDPEVKRSLSFLQKDITRIFSTNHDLFSIATPSDLYKWQILIIGPQNTLYENGIYKAIMTFPKQYPDEPPEFMFLHDMVHPNIESNGKVCISILHSGEDVTGYEKMADRWMPVRTPESVIMSVIMMLDEPNWDSPANLEASILFHSNPQEYERRVRKLAQKTLEEG